MKKILLVIFVCVSFTQLVQAQSTTPSKSKTLEELKGMGLSDSQIQKIKERYKDNPEFMDGVEFADSTGKENPSALKKNFKVGDDSTSTGHTKRKKKKGEKTEKEKADSIDLAQKEKYPKGLIYGQDIFRNGNIKVFEKATDVSAPDNYIIGSGDEIGVAVWGFADYTDNLRVNESGYIYSKLTGRVYVKGLTYADLRELLRKKFGQVTNLNNSQFAVTLNFSRIITVHVVGEVFNPGSYKLPAINTAFNALVAAAGPSQIGSVRNIYIRRDGKTVDSLDVYKFLMQPENNHDVFLQNNDYIVVKVAHKVIKIAGEVKRPHTYELKDQENLNQLIEYSGGINATGFTANIQLLRYDKSKQIILDINLDSLHNNHIEFPLQDADSITVSKIASGVENKVSIVGAMRLTGTFQISSGDRISDLIKKAQGPLYDAYLERAYLTRTRPDLTKVFLPINLGKIIVDDASPENLVLQNLDELKVMSKTDFADSLKITVIGAVRKPGEFQYGSGLNLKDALFLGGGLKPGASNTQIEIARIISYNTATNQVTPVRAVVSTLQLGPELKLSADAEAFKLEPFDQVFVRINPDFQLPKNIILTGEVLYPGKYALLRKNETASDVIKRAGGLTQYAFTDGAMMYRAKDSIGYVYLKLEEVAKHPYSRYDHMLVEGDSIIIPKIINTVQISGAIGNIKEANVSSPYFGGRAKYYIRNFAGGFGSAAIRRKTYVLHADGIVKKVRKFGIFNIYPRVKRGSHIFVPYKIEKIKRDRKEFDWNKFIENTTIKLTGLATLFIITYTIVKKQ